MTGDWKIEDGGQESQDFAVGYKFQNLKCLQVSSRLSGQDLRDSREAARVREIQSSESINQSHYVDCIKYC